MADEEEILRLKKTYSEYERKIEEIGRKQTSTLIELSEWLGKLIENIESTQERGKELENAAVSPRIKLMKKSIKLSKELKNFEVRVVKAFDEGNLSEANGKKFATIVKSIGMNKISLAKEEFGYFEEIIELNRRYETTREELEKKDGMFRREKIKVGKLLEEIKSLEKEVVISEKVQKYENFLNNLEQLEKSRRRYLSTLISESVLELFNNMEKNSLGEYSFPSLGTEETESLRAFLSENPRLEKYTAGQFCELFNSSEKKLMHICPVPEFRQTVLANREWFETICNLERTEFLAVDDENEKVMNFYAENVDGAGKIVEQIMQLRNEKISCKKEYEKNSRIEERKKELSKYSKTELENELKEIEHLFEILHSKPGEKKEAGREKPENKETSGLFSRISSFFK